MKNYVKNSAMNNKYAFSFIMSPRSKFYGIFLLLAFSLSGCCVYQDIKYSINNWEDDEMRVPYYVDVKEVYKPAEITPIRKDDIREITK